MPIARKYTFSPGEEGTFHCWSRCVRGAYLMGDDPLTGKNYDHRRQWMYDRLEIICDAFLIDVLFFAVLSNHFHIALKTHPRLVKRLGAWEVARRWLMICPGKRILTGPPPPPTQQQVEALASDKKRLKEIRKRLSDVSWFMRALKEPFSRRANLEDGTSGTHFESRYKCRRVIDSEGRLVLGIYIDLNVYRAGECRLPWESPHCSAGARYLALHDGKAPKWLAEFTVRSGQDDEVVSRRGGRATDRGCLEMEFDDYLRLLMWAATESKAGGRTLPDELALLVERHGLRPQRLAELLDELPRLFPSVLGATAALRQLAADHKRRWFHGVGHAGEFFRD